MAFKGKDQVRSRVAVENNLIEQVNSSNYLGNLISYEREVDFDNPCNDCLKITCIINIMFKPQKTLKKTSTKVYSTLALPALLYSGENWTITARDAGRKTAAEMKYI